MRKNLFFNLLAILFISTATLAQTGKPTITYTVNETLLINGKAVTSTTLLEDFKSLLGEPDREIAYPSGEVGHMYDKIGLMAVESDGMIKAYGVNFNWDGDKKFPETTFTGTLMIDSTEITKDATSDLFSALNSIEFICPFPLMCASKNREADVNVSIAFKDGQMTQMTFLLR